MEKTGNYTVGILYSNDPSAYERTFKTKREAVKFFMELADIASDMRSILCYLELTDESSGKKLFSFNVYNG